MEQSPTVITIGPVRFSYLNCFEAKAIKDGDTPKYSVSALIDKKDKPTLKKIEKAIEAAKQLGKDSKWGGKIPSNLKLPLRDGEDRPEDEAYEGCMYMSCNATTKPGVVNSNREPIMDKDEVQSGDYGFLNVSIYPFNSNGSKGIAVGFNHLMKTKTGERLSGRVSVDDAFGDVEVDDDDANSLM